MSANHMEVCHLWASGNKESGKGFNVYFEGREIFSYGSHFMLGFRMGPALFFLNSSGYSISTSKHKTFVWRAAHGDVFHVPNLTAYRYELRTLARFREGKADKADARKAGARMIERLAPAIGNGGAWDAETVSRDAVERLALESGYTAKQAAALIERAAKAGERARLADAKREAANVRRAAMRAAAVPLAWHESRVAGYIATMRGAGDSDTYSRGRYMREDAKRNLERDAKEAGRQHKAGSAAKLGKRTVARLWAIVRLYRAALADANAKERQRERLAAFRVNRAALASGLARLASAPADVGPGFPFGTFASVAQSARLIRPAVRAATRERLDSLIAWADGRAEWEAAESARIANARRAAEIADWRAGRGRASYFDSDHGGAAIRATGVERDASGAIVGGTLETSHGAAVPLPHAIRVFRFLKLMRERGERWERNGRTIRVGHYSVDRVNPDGGFTAGCHRFAWGEIEALAVALGVFDIAPADVRESSPVHA